MVEKVEVAIVGAGSAGLFALRQVRDVTQDFVLIDAGDWGTTCAARGCMPSKALIESANVLHRARSAAALGLTGGEGVAADIPAVLARVRRLRDAFVKGPQATSAKLGDRAISGRARLLGPDRLQVGDRVIEAGRIILATGGRPIVPADWARFGDRVITSDDIFELPDLPRRVAVIGMGAIGLELAQAMSRLGVEVAGFDAAQTMGGVSDPLVLEALRAAIAREFPVHLGGPAEIAEEGAALRVTGAGGEFRADAVLAAIGRRPNVDDIGLETLGVPLDKTGLPSFDPDTMRIPGTNVWLAGDANGHLPLMHEAADEGFIAGRNAVSDAPAPFRRRPEIAIVFCAPQVARVGARFADLDPATTVVGAVDFAKQGRARTADKAEGALRVYAERETGRLLGAEMCAPAAEHLAHLLALALTRDLAVSEILAMPFYHPVFEEGLRSALREAAAATPQPRRDELCACPPSGCDALD